MGCAVAKQAYLLGRMVLISGPTESTFSWCTVYSD